MEKISFENFRKFEKFPEICFGDINILVGANNSGKSTLTKAILLCAYNLLKMESNTKGNVFGHAIPRFYFDMPEAKVMTVERALRRTKKNAYLAPMQIVEQLSKEKMHFKFSLRGFIFDVDLRVPSNIIGDLDYQNRVYAEMTGISIEDTWRNLKISVSYVDKIMSVEFMNAEEYNQIQETVSLWKELDAQKRVLDSANSGNDVDFEAIAQANARISQITEALKKIIREDDASDDEITKEEVLEYHKKHFRNSRELTCFDLPYNKFTEVAEEPEVLNVFTSLMFWNSIEEVEDVNIEDSNEYGEYIQNRQLMEKYKREIRSRYDLLKESRGHLSNAINIPILEYIPAHYASQKLFYNYVDEKDYTANTIHEFYKECSTLGCAGNRFVKQWMKQFGIGDDYEIFAMKGEAYSVVIKDDGIRTPLADKGMGSIQMMLLLFRLATFIHKYNGRTEMYRPTIIIEEPELNLHPEIQSLLADLFKDLCDNTKYSCNFRFIIETHSEYFVRKTQVLVAEEGYEDDEVLKDNNPFKVFYLPADGKDYFEVGYNTSGTFKKKFGTGFFDAAGELHMAILRKSRQQK